MEYIQDLYIALSLAGESVSGYHAYRKAGQLSEEDFEILDRQAFKLENGLLRPIESLERKTRLQHMDRNADHQRIEWHRYQRKY